MQDNRKAGTEILKEIVLNTLTWGAIVLGAYYITNPSQIAKNNHSANYNTNYHPSAERMDSR